SLDRAFGDIRDSWIVRRGDVALGINAGDGAHGRSGAIEDTEHGIDPGSGGGEGEGAGSRVGIGAIARGTGVGGVATPARGVAHAGGRREQAEGAGRYLCEVVQGPGDAEDDGG